MSDVATLSFEAIGTHWRISLPSDVQASSLSDIEKSIHRRISEFDEVYSRFRSDSLVSRMAREAGSFTLPNDTGSLLDLYEQMYECTGGKVTPLIGRTLEQAGYDPLYSLKAGAVTSPPEYDKAVRREGNALHLETPQLLDFGAAGKGYLADLVAEVLEGAGLETYTINAGGDIVARNGMPITIGLEHPNLDGNIIGTAALTSGSLCGSATNRREWGAYHHIIDPHVLNSPRHIAAIWVAAPTGLQADGISTCLFFSEPAQLASIGPFEYLIVYEDMSARMSDNFPGTLY